MRFKYECAVLNVRIGGVKFSNQLHNTLPSRFAGPPTFRMIGLIAVIRFRSRYDGGVCRKRNICQEARKLVIPGAHPVKSRATLTPPSKSSSALISLRKMEIPRDEFRVQP